MTTETERLLAWLAKTERGNTNSQSWRNGVAYATECIAAKLSGIEAEAVAARNAEIAAAGRGDRPMTMPVRIQRRRTRGWRMPEGAIYVGRPTVFGNPYRITGRPRFTPKEAVALFREMVLNWNHDYRMRWIEPLRGHDLACWCPEECGEPVGRYEVAYSDVFDPCAKPKGHDGAHDPWVALWCHADVLLELANR